jgi:pyrimidine operon attenuation protein/uracil phosphoribosyltransferase
MTIDASTINVDKTLDTITAELKREMTKKGISSPLMIGIHTGGLWLAENLHQRMALDKPLGEIDISFYRDDFTRIGVNPQVKPSNIPLSVEGENIILVDDVLYTGRTIRAALNEIFDYGRPNSVTLVVLLDRGERELPIQADVIGLQLDLSPEKQVKLIGPVPLALEIINI